MSFSRRSKSCFRHRLMNVIELIKRPRALGSCAAGVLLSSLAVTAAEARTCAVDVDELREIRRLAIDLAGKSMTVDRDRAREAQRKVGQALRDGSVSLDVGELKGLVRPKGKLPKEAVQQLAGRILKIYASCGL